MRKYITNQGARGICKGRPRCRARKHFLGSRNLIHSELRAPGFGGTLRITGYMGVYLAVGTPYFGALALEVSDSAVQVIGALSPRPFRASRLGGWNPEP